MWKKIGLKHNIFFTHALQANSRDAKLHVGRENDAQTATRVIDLDEKSIQIITGKFGIGKTSFINVFQFNIFSRSSEEKRILPCYRPVQITDENSYKDFVINILLSLCENIREYYLQTNKRIPEEIKFQIDYWLGIRRDKTAAGREIELDLQILKFKGTSTIEDSIWNESDPEFSLKELIALFLKKSKLNGIFLCVDNLELAKIEHVVKVLDVARDTLFSIEKVHWLFVSSKETLANDIYINSQRFSSIISGSQINIRQLTHNQLFEIIENRIDLYNITKYHLELPFENEVISKIYSFTNQDLRESFKILQYLFAEIFSNNTYCIAYLNKGIQVNFFEVRNKLIDYCMSYSNLFDISKSEIKLLETIFINNPISILDIEASTPLPGVELTKSLIKLEKFGFIIKDENDSFRDTFRLKIIALSNKIGPAARDLAYDQLDSNINSI